MKYLSLIMLIGSFFSLSAQDTTTFESRRDWFVGKYEGIASYNQNADTTTGFWFEETIEYTYNQYLDPESIECSNSGGGWYKVCEDSIAMSALLSVCDIADSLFKSTWNMNYTSGFAKLFPDSTLIYWYINLTEPGSYFYYFIGKKTESYAGMIIKNAWSDYFNIYPNPAMNNIRINLNSWRLHGGKIEIFNIRGEIVKTVPAGIESTNIDVSALPQGVYIIKFTENNILITKKLVLNRLR